MARWRGELVAAACYCLNFLCFLSTALFTSRDQLVARWICSAPVASWIRGIDGESARSTHPLHPADFAWALVGNLGLLLLFSLQHSIMGRLRFKDLSEKLIGAGGERATHLLGSVGVMQLLMRWWAPIVHPAPWHLPSLLHNDSSAALSSNSASLWLGTTFDVLHVLAWLWLLGSLVTIFVYDLFCYRTAMVPHLQMPGVVDLHPNPPLVYRWTRHPIFSSLLAAMWLTSRMSLGRLVWTLAFTVYTVTGIVIQERDLLRKDAKEGKNGWRSYMASVPRLMPWPLASPTSPAESRTIEKGGLAAWMRTRAPLHFIATHISSTLQPSYLVELFLPVASAHAVDPSRSPALRTTRKELLDQFGGVTTFTRSPAQGLWVDDESDSSNAKKGHTERDTVVAFEILAESIDIGWWREYQAKLRARFKQKEMLIRTTQVAMITT